MEIILTNVILSLLVAIMFVVLAGLTTLLVFGLMHLGGIPKK